MNVLLSLQSFNLYTWELFGAAICISWSGYLVASLSALAFKLPLARIKSIAIVTVLQNPLIALAIVANVFSSPNSDIASTPIYNQIIFSIPPLLVTYFINAYYDWKTPKKVHAFKPQNGFHIVIRVNSQTINPNMLE
jgi:hypothetical protein